MVINRLWHLCYENQPSLARRRSSFKLQPVSQVSYLDSLRRQPQTVADLGALLLGFLRRYGCLFRLESEAVSVPGGGIVAKRRDWKGEKQLV